MSDCRVHIDKWGHFAVQTASGVHMLLACRDSARPEGLYYQTEGPKGGVRVFREGVAIFLPTSWGSEQVLYAPPVESKAEPQPSSGFPIF